MDLSNYSDAELEAIAGGGGSDLSGYSDAELEAIAGDSGSTSKNPNLDYLVQSGAKGIGGALTMPMSLAGVIQNIPPFSWASKAGSKLASALTGEPEKEPEQNLNSAYAEKIQQAIMDNATRNTGKVDEKDVSAPVRYTGAAVSALPYAAYGGGILPAVTAGLGGQGGKDLAKAVNAGPRGELIAEVAGAIAGGSIPAAASSMARGSVKAITGERTAEEAAKALQNKAIGGRLSDFIRNAKKDYFDPLLGSTDEVAGTIKGAADSSLIETQLTKNIDEVISSGTFEKGAKTPKALYQANQGKMQEIGQIADDVIKTADEALGQTRIYPKKFEYAEAYIKSNRVPLEDKPRLMKMLAEAKQRYKSSIYDSYADAGALSVWQKEKQALQNVTYKDDRNREILEKYLGADIRKFVEDVADQFVPPGTLKDINAQYAKHASVNSILERNAVGTEVATQGAKELLAQATTGGTRTGPSLRGAATGASTGAILGTALGAPGLGAGIGGLLGIGAGYTRGKMLEYVNSPSGQFALADFLSAMSSGSKKNQLEMLGKIFGPGLVKSTPQSAAIGANMDDSKKKVSEPAMATPKDIKAIEAEIDADPYYSTLYEIESDRNPKAKNPDSSASGGFQLIKSTAKSLGVADPFDLEQAFKGAKKLTEEHARKFKTQDPVALYSLHYLGEDVYRRWQAGKPLNKDERAQVMYLSDKVLPKFKRVYASKVKADTEFA